MDKTCEYCGKEFSNETDFDQHVLLEKIGAGNVKVFRIVADRLNWIGSNLLWQNVLLVQRRDHSDYETAVKTWYMESIRGQQLWNRLHSEAEAKGETNEPRHSLGQPE